MSAGTVRRGPILLALIVVMVAAIVFDDRGNAPATRGAGVGNVAAGPALAASDALTSSWFCAEGTSTPDGRADETVVIASVADTRIDATVTVMLGGLTPMVSRTVHVAPRREARVHLADLVVAAEPAVVVEVVGGQAAVVHEVAANGDIATEPCARGASTDWYFAAGTTLKGAQQYIVLFDPFGDDAIVDLTFLTDDGVQEPDALQAVVVPRRSRVSIPVADSLPRQRDVAVHVHARSGRVVADRTQLFDGTASDGEVARKGIALSLGAEAPAHEWNLAYGTTTSGEAGVVGVANFGPASTVVDVNVVLDGDQTIAAESVAVPARSVRMVDVAGRVPADSRYAVQVIARDVEGNAPPVVAEALDWRPMTATSPAVATAVGSSQPARRWVVALVSKDDEGVVTVLNPGTRRLTVTLHMLRASGGSRRSRPRRVDSGHVTTFDLARVGAQSDGVLVVVSDHPSTVGITLTGPGGAAVASAVPDFSYGVR
jgi:hypothetical protein